MVTDDFASPGPAELFRGRRSNGVSMVLQRIISLFTALLLGGCMQATVSQTTQNPVSDANFTARDKQQLANPPYERASIPLAYQRQIVQYHRKEAPGSILVDTDARYVYYVLPEGRAIRYGRDRRRGCAGLVRRRQGRSQGRMAGMDTDRG